MELDYISGIPMGKMYGFRRYQEEIHSRLKKIRRNEIQYTPSKYRIVHFFQRMVSYPWEIKHKIKKGNIKCIVTPDLAYLQNFFKFKKCIINCYDTIMYTRYRDYDFFTRFFLRMNIRGLKKATLIITESDSAKKDIIRYLEIPESRIRVIKPAVDLKTYYPKRDKTILKKYGLSETEKVIMHVGSEEPRQNVDKILKAIAILKKKLPNVKFLKVGDPQWAGAREKLTGLVKELGLENTVIFAGYADPYKLLPKLYNAADIVVYPCAYAGWGLPPLEAMACGTPVITSNTTSLPEVVGDAGIMIDPENIEEFSDKMHKLLRDKKLWNELSKKGVKRAKQFNWDKSARETERVYKEVVNLKE